MTASFVVDAETTNGTAGTSVVVNRPTGTLPGHLLVAVISATNTPALTAPAGWNLIESKDASTAIRSAAYWRIAAAGDPASWTWTLGSSQRNLGYIAALDGVNTSDPIYDHSATADTTAGTAWSASLPPELMPGAGAFGFVAAVRTASGAATTWTTSGTERADMSTNGGAGTDIGGAATVGSYTGDRFDTLYLPTFTSSQSCDQGVIWAITLRPAFVAYNPASLVDVVVEAAFGEDPDGDPEDWTWTDVSAALRGKSGVTITAGRQDAAGQSSTTRVTFELNNPFGYWTPENAESIYWPNIRRGLPIRISVPYGYGPNTELATVFIESYTLRWDADDRHSVVRVEAFGRWHRIEGRNRPVQSVLTRYITRHNPGPWAYWPADTDGSGASLVSAITANTNPLNAAGSVSFAADSTLGGSGPLPTLGDGAVIAGSVPAYTATGFWAVTMVMKIPAPVAAVNHILTVKTTGTARTWTITLVPGSPDSIDIRAYDAAGTQILADAITINEATFYGDWKLHTIAARQNGANIDYTQWYHDSGAGAGQSGTLNSRTHGNAQTIHTAANSVTAGTVVGHYAVWTDPDFDEAFDPAFIALAALDGNADESPLTRFARLCEENGIEHDTFGVAGATHTGMSAQPPGTLPDLLRDTEKVGHALIHDRGRLGALIQVSRSYRYNATPAIVLDNARQQLTTGFEPVFDTTGIRSESTVRREGGSSARYVGDESEGHYPDAETFNLFDDSRLYEIAGWRTNSASVKGKRYPRLGFDLRKSPELLEAWLLSKIGDRLQAINLPQQHGPVGDIADVYMEGYSQFIDGERWTVTPVCSPAEPYQVAVVDATDDSVWRLETDGATLTSAITATQTSFQVSTAAGMPLFTTAAGDFPVDIAIGGEQITISAISGTSSPQTFTATVRAKNGVTKAHAAGAVVTGWKIRPVGL